MINNYKKLYIYTLGQLTIKKGEQILFSGNQKLNKRWKLFMLLLAHRGEILSDNELIYELSLDENATPRQSLRALIYRLRKEINFKDEDYINTHKGGYSFNTKSDYWLDLDKFNNIIDEAKKNLNKEKIVSDIVSLYKRALRIYKGSVLANHNLDNKKLLEKRNYYRDIFLESVKELADYQLDQNNYDEVVEIYETALHLYPFEVDLYLALIKSLKQSERPGMARIKSEEALAFLSNVGMDIPQVLKDEVSSFINLSPNNDVKFVLNNNSKNDQKVFECGPLTFSNIYNLEKRRAARENNKIELLHFQLNKSNSAEKNREAEIILKECLHESLRSSDIITRWQPRHYLLLVLDLSEEKISKIVKRIKDNYEAKSISPEINLVYKSEEV
mgnify:CR=1 FL=1